MAYPYFAYQNLLPSATVTARTENSSYPASNLTKHRLWPGWRSGDKSLDFDGDIAYAFASDHADFNITGDLTIEVMIKPDSVTGIQSIVNKLSTTDGYALRLNGDEVELKIDNSGSTDGTETTTAANIATDGTWYRIKAVYDASAQDIKFYINGLLAASSTTGTIPTSIGTNSRPVGIGVNGFLYDEHYDGEIAYVGIDNAEHDHGGYLDPSGCVGYWKFDSSDLTDSSGNGHTLTWNQALDLNGSNEYATHADHADFDITGDMTIEILFKLDKVSGTQILVDKANTLTAGYILNITGDEVRTILRSASLNCFVTTTSANLTTDTWYRLKMVYDASAAEVAYYINGSEIGRGNNSTQTNVALDGPDATIPSSLGNSATHLSIGAGNTPANYFDGQMAFLGIDNAEDDDGSPLVPSNCSGYWLFDGGLTDASGNAHTLTGSGIGSTNYVDAHTQTYSSLTAYQWVRINNTSTQNPSYLFIDRRHNISNGITIKLYRQSPYESLDLVTSEAVTAGAVIIIEPSSTTDVDWWIEIHDPDNADGYIEIPYIYLGAKTDLNRGFAVPYGYSPRTFGTVIADSAGGLTGYARSEQLWEAELVFKPLTTDFATIEAVADVARLMRPVVFSEDATDAKTRLIYWKDAQQPRYEKIVDPNPPSSTRDEITMSLQECGGGV